MSRRLGALSAIVGAVCSLPSLARAATDPLPAAARAFAGGDPAGALKHLPRRLPDPAANLLRARAFLALKGYEAALQGLEGLEQALPQLQDLVRFLEGEARYGQKDYLGAARAFRAAARTQGSRWIYRSWRRRAEALRDGGRYTQAAAEFAHVLKVQPRISDRPELELDLALCQARAGQLQAAAERLRAIWLEHPLSAAAVRAEQELERLRGKGRIRLPVPTPAQRLARARSLRRAKRYAEATVELEALRRGARSPATAAQLDYELALTHSRHKKPELAIPLLRTLLARRGRPLSQPVRSLLAESLASLGKIEEGAQLYLQRSWREQGKLTSGQQADLRRAAGLYADFGRYAEALKLYERLLMVAPMDKDRQLELCWISYRAGRFDQAIERLESWSRRAPGHQDFMLYWQARAHARAGRLPRAEELYRKVMTDHARSYYGILARSRLWEMKRIKLQPGRCPAAAAAGKGGEESVDVLRRLEAMSKRHGVLFPSLQRAEILWRVGMREDARRELRLVAIDLAWVAARGRPRSYIQRPDVERLWRDGPLAPRRWGKRERAIFQEGVALRHEVGLLLSAAGISYFGWRFSPRTEEPERRWHPRAYPELVRATAKRFNLDPNLIWAIMKTESSYRLDVISRVGARGLMQIMPNTARRIVAAMKLEGFELVDLFDPETNLLLAGWYLRALSDKFQGQIPLIAAGYNGGPHHVARWLDQRGRGADTDEFIEEIPFSESRRYAKKILRLLVQYERLYCAKDDRRAPNKLMTRYAPAPDF